MHQPVDHDVAREAKDALRGYSYQMLRSILSWLTLSNGDCLILEGAEDIDRLSEDAATLEQIKDTAGSGNITLRVPSVVEAIRNYWDHVGRNRNRRLLFRYVTTSAIGREKGNPFGNVNGLDLWSNLRSGVGRDEAIAGAVAIGRFLADNAALPSDLRSFLGAAPGDQILDSLIAPIEWVTAEGDSEAMMQAVRDRLVEIGHSRNIGPNDAEKALGTLHIQAIQAATARPSVPLTFADALRFISTAAEVSLPTSQLTALIAQAFGISGNDLVKVEQTTFFETPPPLPSRYISRPAIESQIIAALSKGNASVQASTGMGKTTLASAVAARSGDTIWLHLRDLEADAVRLRLRAAEQFAKLSGRALLLVLDDFGPFNDPAKVDGPLRAASLAVRAIGGAVLCVSAHHLPPRLAAALDISSSEEIFVPPLAADEIVALLKEAGCQDARAETWSKILEVSCNGHLQLISARLETLSRAGFPGPSTSDLLPGTDDVQNIQREASRLINSLPDEPRELLCRLSLMTGAFDRDRIFAIARLREPLLEPGEAIDQLVGPWLETLSRDQHRTSPLARSAGIDARGRDWAVAMHRQLAFVYLTKRSITPDDIFAVFTHSIIGRSMGALAHVMGSILQAGENAWLAIAETCSMFMMIGIEPSLDLEKPIDHAIFRIFQLRIASSKKDESRLAAIIAAADKEQSGTTDTQLSFFRFLFLMQLLVYGSRSLPLTSLLAYAQEMLTLGASLQDSFPARAAAAGVYPEPLPEWPDQAMFPATAIVERTIDRDGLEALVDELEKLDEGFGQQLLAAVGRDDEFASFFLDRVWLAEQRGDKDNRSLIDLFRRVYALVKGKAIAPIASAAAALIVRMLDEDLGDPMAAIAAADTFLNELPDPHPSLSHAKAKVIARSGDPATALAIWRDALPKWDVGYDHLSCSIAFREAALAAFKLGRHGEAVELLGRAIGATDEVEHQAYYWGLVADKAFGSFLAGDRNAALAGLQATAAMLEPLEPISNTEPIRSLQRRVMAVITVVNQARDGLLDPAEIEKCIGLCSDLSPMLGQGDQPAFDYLALNLIMAGIDAPDVVDLPRWSSRVRRTRLLMIRAAAPDSLFRLAVANGEFEHVIADGIRQIEALGVRMMAQLKGKSSAFAEAGDDPLPWQEDSTQFIVLRLVACCFVAAARGSVAQLPIAAWRADIPDRPDASILNQRVDQIDALLVSRTRDPWATMNDQAVEGWERCIATLALASSDRCPPERLMLCHAIWLLSLRLELIKEACEQPVAELIARQWEAAIAAPVLLNNPRISVAAIQAAIAGDATGWKKSRRILRAALFAVPVPADHWIHDALAEPDA